MEIYRSLTNCAIWLDAASFPAKDSGSPYQADAAAYSNEAFFDKSASAAVQAAFHWSTSATTSTFGVPWDGEIPAKCTAPLGTPPASAPTPPHEATQAIQTLAGPDGASYDVYTYIILAQPAGGSWVKKVTIVVRDKRNGRVAARETSFFNPLSG
jgi:hypothetical protein